MAYDTTYTQSTYALANAAFDYESDNTSEPTNDQLWDEPTSNSNAPGWQWTTGTSPSSSTGPPASNGGCVFPESSSPMATGDINMATLVSGNEVDASQYLLYVDIDMCTYGNTTANMQVQAFDGSTWNTLTTQNGNATTTFTSVTDLDCTSYTNSDFSVRVVVNMASSGNVYQCDFAFQNLRIHGADAVTDPVITNAGDEDYTLYETNIVITGTDFGTDTALADVELGDSATYGSATLVSQSVDTWADTSIQFDLTLGTLDQEQLWLYVTNSDGDVSNAWEVNVNMTPTLTDCGDELFDTDETNITLTGTAFESLQGTGKLELSDNATYATGTKVTQSIDTWANGSIQFDMTISTLTAVDLWLWVTNDLGFRNATGYSVQAYQTPVISDIEDEEFNASETNIVLDGTGFALTQGTGKVELSDNATYATGSKVSQTINTWDEDEIVFDLEIGSIGTSTMWMWVTNSVGELSLGTQVTITGLPISTGIWQQASIQGSITSTGFDTTIFLISDED